MMEGGNVTDMSSGDNLNIQSRVHKLKLNVSKPDRFMNITLALFTSLKIRDYLTAEHSALMATYTHKLALAFDSKNADLYYAGALLHDIGKLGMDDSILKGTTRLSEEQRRSLSKHVEDGKSLLTELGMPQLIIDIAHFHHERFNGSGYPKGLKGQAIPLCARITGITDTYSALIAGRPYQKQKEPADAIQTMMESREHFDPAIFDLFVTIICEEEHLKINQVNNLKQTQ